ncbi:TPA: RNA methyltransferase [Candidatus Campbellbacteria bacterium]|nr:MAG: tRNA/rRNA methyltransferase SpoU [Candidatus Campbellbacteria bacterium GW2011_OD1_34_28]KKP75264.1 MAG: tRNA/rRNA methyltransferase (SpoU) [Candidatus Campbellbacteria bacterium GW2011_GWD2_35_24]KKP76175.1 MAG: tRNA/rRNA methyltransferase SpoU [Candidatus Campbellbacteria bacterium GW2011_GWC2_35_28]KKP77364.1 MAG: tRNA/rRNA methyltransferase (SpoU) [Candidatus Campbellbacteria bacterium GW2011_GWC1_35_31]KKP79293.1 MAG: tRNA/rRNA methyltransferase (SpoU) [Candidatus Campbellbacteria 
MLKKDKKKVFVILDNIRSVHNVGAIFRTADACGVSKIFLVGYTPQPLDRFGRMRKDLSKSALGAEKNIEWEYYKEITELVDVLKKNGVEVVAIEQNKKSIDYKKFGLKKDTAFILGNEVDGVSKNILESVDKIIEIPMVGKKESLNVSVSAGIVLFRILNI